MDTQETQWCELGLGERVDLAEGRLGELTQTLSGAVTWDDDDDLVYLVGTTSTGREFQLDVSLEDARVVLRVPVRRGSGWMVLRYHAPSEREDTQSVSGGDRRHLVAPEVACPVSPRDQAQQLATLDALPSDLRDRLFSIVRELVIAEWILNEDADIKFSIKLASPSPPGGVDRAIGLGDTRPAYALRFEDGAKEAAMRFTSLVLLILVARVVTRPQSRRRATKN